MEKRICFGVMTMRCGKWTAVLMAATMLCIFSSDALASSSDPPEPTKWSGGGEVSPPVGGDDNGTSESTVETNLPRFIEILRDDSFIYLMDRKTARYKNIPHLSKERMIDVWIKLEPVEYLEGDYTFPAKYYLEHYLIRPKTQQIQFLCELEVAGRPSNEIEDRRYDPRRWEKLIPGSIEDSIYHAVILNEEHVYDESSANGTSVRDFIEDTLNVSL